MTFIKEHGFLALFTLSYIVGFGGYYMSAGNLEFMWYVFVLVFFAALIGATLSKTHFPAWILWLLSWWGFLHMAGGGVRVGDGVLYAYRIVHLFGEGESFVLKFDQVVHFYGFFVATLVVWHLLRPHVTNLYSVSVLLTVLFAGVGLGALNEIVEFLAVVAIPETGVGGYYNTALDLVFNMLGAVSAVLLLRYKGRQLR